VIHLHARDLTRRHLGQTVTIGPLLHGVVFRPDGIDMVFGDGSVVPVPPDTPLIVRKGQPDGMVRQDPPPPAP
jgi:hypothetical protein